MDEIKKGINPNLIPVFTQKIESKSTAIQYAIDVTTTYDKDGNKAFNLDLAKKVFDFICQSVDLPDVPKGLFDNMDVNIEKLKEQIKWKLSDIDPEIKDAVDEHFWEMIDSKKEQECSCASCTCKKKPVTERIKTFEDACNELGVNHPFVVQYNDIFNKYLYGTAESNTCDIVAYLKLRIICAALNEGWEPQFTENESRYYTYFTFYPEEEVEKMDEETKNELGLFGGLAYHGSECGPVAAGAGVAFCSASADIGYRLCLKSEELAEYCGRQFIDLWKDYYMATAKELI